MSPPAKGRPRRDAILSLAVPAEIVVDVGCDHGHISAALGAIGVERRSGRLPRREDIARVVADGLSAFRRVDLAIITGMGAHTILGILDRGPTPTVAVLHSPSHCDQLRLGLVERGWRIDAERLAPEGRRFAEVMRVRRGQETARGMALRFGPRLDEDPLVLDHARQLRGHYERIRDSAPARSEGGEDARAWVAWLDGHIATLERR